MAGLGGIRGGAVHRTYSVTVFVILAALENVAIGLPVPLYDPIGRGLGVSEGAVSLVTAASFLVTAVAAVGWAYTGDRTNRKPLLMGGTAIWALAFGGCGLTHGYLTYFALQMLASVGLGAVASVGFSVVSDLISPRRRGLVMSLWGLSHGVGTLGGTLVGGLLGAGSGPDDWRRPFLMMAAAGLVAVVAYFFVYNIRRGQSEPELAALFEAGGEYKHRINRSDVRGILRRRTNVWLILQGLTAQATFGSLVWLPRLLQAKAQAQGYPEATAIVVGSVFSVLYQLGGALSIIGGLVGDRLQRRTRRGRALVAAFGILAGVPFYVVLFFVPLNVHVPAGAGKSDIVLAVLHSVATEPTVAISFLAALLALALTSANSPNWFALLADVNPPEHRGTVYSMGNLVNGVGRAAGNSLVSVMFRVFTRALPPPLNYATGLAVFQVFFIPTGVMYYLASRTVGEDMDAVRGLLRQRAATDRSAPSEGESVTATTAP